MGMYFAVAVVAAVVVVVVARVLNGGTVIWKLGIYTGLLGRWN